MTWRAPECPFEIEWSADVMDEIRVAGMEALFSLPHGGAEIGGVLWGTHDAGRVRIVAAGPLACEYASGPTFTLSGKDQARLAALLEGGSDDGRSGPREQGWEPVGWYHSHTRSEILLSARDLEIHNRYFPDPWQVALVVRPHAMQPMRAGFFFREADGSIHADSSYREFLLEPAPRAAVAPAAPPAAVEQTVSPVVSLVAASSVQPRAQPSRGWLLWVAIWLGMAVGLFAFKYDWMRVFAADRTPSVSLMAYDLDGQLQIRWDWGAEPIRSAEGGSLEITDGAAHTVVALERQRLRGGTVSYVRTGDRVDVRLALRGPGEKLYEEFTSFIGHAGEPAAEGSTAALRLELQDQGARVRELERAVGQMASNRRQGVSLNIPPPPLLGAQQEGAVH